MSNTQFTSFLLRCMRILVKKLPAGEGERRAGVVGQGHAGAVAGRVGDRPGEAHGGVAAADVEVRCRGCGRSNRDHHHESFIMKKGMK